jgi:hypothetical protein
MAEPVTTVQTASGPQSDRGTHAEPAAGTAAQVPHTWPGAIEQNVLAHCPWSPHAAPAASVPAGGAHAGFASSENCEHVAPAIELAHASTFVVVRPVPVAMSAATHGPTRRVSQLASLP